MSQRHNRALAADGLPAASADLTDEQVISRVRSGVKGHFSYRDVAWRMKLKMEQLEPELGRLIEATPPWVEDPLQR